MKLSDLLEIINQTDDTTRIFNLWATWCGPCVKELPYFEEINQKYKDAKIKVLLVAVEDTKEKVEKFVIKKNMQSKVMLLDEKDANYWIPKIDKDWEGEIPVSLIINNKENKRTFIKGETTLSELEKIIQSNSHK